MRACRRRRPPAAESATGGLLAAGSVGLAVEESTERLPQVEVAVSINRRLLAPLGVKIADAVESVEATEESVEQAPAEEEAPAEDAPAEDDAK